MTYKLFDVHVHYNAIVVADDWDDAYFNAKEMLDSIIGTEEPEIEVQEEIKKLPSDWIGVVPYGGDGTMTCDQILFMTDEERKEKVIENLTDEQKKEILSKMTLQEICDLLNKND